MGLRLQLVLGLLAFTSLQVIQGSTIAEPDTDDDDITIPILIPLPQSYNMSTLWLGRLRDSYTRVISFERTQRLQQLSEAAKDIKDMTRSYKMDMADLVGAVGAEGRSCVVEHKEQLLQVLSTVDAELQGCANPLESVTSDYDQQLEEILKKVDAQDEASIYTPCLPTQRLTRKVLERAQKCFQSHYRESVETFYFPIGRELFSALSENHLRLNTAQTTAEECARAMIETHDQMLTEKLEGLRECTNTAAKSGDFAHHSRQKRGFGKKLRKAWKKVRNGAKKLCMKIPCQIGYSVALPGK